MKIKVVSFDIFQTLVDVNKRIPQIWQSILGESYTKEKGIKGANAVLDSYLYVFNKALSSNHFQTMQSVYYDCALLVIEKTGYPVTPDSIVYSLLYQHSQAPLYDDVLSCLKLVHERYKIILSSDSNHLMIDNLTKYFIYDKVFISDDLYSYKASPDGKFFSTVIKQLNVNPNEIIHIGDSSSDITGAFRAGINSCWLNRTSDKWKNIITPDYIIESLSELHEILSL